MKEKRLTPDQEAREAAFWREEVAKAGSPPTGSRKPIHGIPEAHPRDPGSPPMGTADVDCTSLVDVFVDELITTPHLAVWSDLVPGEREGGFFVPLLPARVLHALIGLSASALWVFLLAWRRWTVKRERWIVLPHGLLRHFGVPRESERRGLTELARAGLVTVTQAGPRRARRVALHPRLHAALPRKSKGQPP